ncbi:MAG: hypothetical protein IJL32_04440 [Oscillospiraceae bacterium]|nr:hypothetical protein [Oscillospiraceae bacterium]MBQ9905252.1 hypothetical protein [Oscillospiraceae bacterium]
MAAKRKKTPAECVAAIVTASMAVRSMTARQLADLVGVHYQTVYNDLKDPNKMTMYRMWLYFTALDVPIDKGLEAFADSFARSLVVQ